MVFFISGLGPLAHCVSGPRGSVHPTCSCLFHRGAWRSERRWSTTASLLPCAWMIGLVLALRVCFVKQLDLLARLRSWGKRQSSYSCDFLWRSKMAEQAWISGVCRGGDFVFLLRATAKRQANTKIASMCIANLNRQKLRLQTSRGRFSKQNWKIANARRRTHDQGIWLKRDYGVFHKRRPRWGGRGVWPVCNQSGHFRTGGRGAWAPSERPDMMSTVCYK